MYHFLLLYQVYFIASFLLKLKNSGTTGDDVKVSYITDDKEIPIESQADFQIALYTFRRKARNSEIITLTLDRMSNFKECSPKQVHRFDVQTQVHTDALECKENDLTFNEGPPEWFKKYMKKVTVETIKVYSGNGDLFTV